MKKSGVLKKIISDGLPVLSSLSRSQQNEVAKWAQHVVKQFDMILGKNPAKIRDITLLPCTKHELRLAIKILMLSHLIKGFDKSIENLKQRYISLASFQPFDPEDRKLFEEISDSGKDDSEANSNGIYPSYQKFLDLALVERNALLNDVENFIEDFKAAH